MDNVRHCHVKVLRNTKFDCQNPPLQVRKLSRARHIRNKAKCGKKQLPASAFSFICMFHLFLKSSLFRDYSRKPGFCDTHPLVMGHTSAHRPAQNSRNGPNEALINTGIGLNSNLRDDQACFVHDIL